MEYVMINRNAVAITCILISEMIEYRELKCVEKKLFEYFLQGITVIVVICGEISRTGKRSRRK